MPPKKKVVKQRGKGIIGNVVTSAQNAYRRNFCDGKARPLLPGERHLPCHNFTGPGTRIDLPEVRAYKPYNAIDACSKQHDLDYLAAASLTGEAKARAIMAADVKDLACYDRHKDVSGYAAAKAGIKIKNVAENAVSRVAGKPTVLYGGRKKKKAVKKMKLPKRNNSQTDTSPAFLRRTNDTKQI
jgi:hypothetical protein